MKKEPVFPHDSVEAYQPVEVKKRKINSRDLTPIDPWKLYMSLKSGLLAESTWAIDALNILLYDDSTVAYFNLKHFPGLVSCLLEHFLKCLKLIFDKENGNEFADLFANEYPIENDSYDESDLDEEDELEDTKLAVTQTNVKSVLNNSSKDSNQASCSENSDSSASSEDEADSDSKNNNNSRSRTKRSTTTKNGSAKKQQNGHAKGKANNSTTPTGKRKPGRPFKNKPVEDVKQSVNDPVNVTNELQVMRVNFNDREARKRFLHYYKSAKISDSKVNEQWLVYNNKILEQHKVGGSRNKVKASTDAKQKRSEAKELNNHILTSFSTGQEIKNLKKLFYGSEFYSQLENNQTKGENDQANSRLDNQQKPLPEAVGKTAPLKRKINEDFVSRHRTYESSKKCLYSDHLIDEEEKIFKVVDEKRTELVQRCVALSTIFRNLSFVPGNEQELCKFKLLLRLLARLLVIKHNHTVVVAEEAAESALEDGGSEDEEYRYYDDELVCIKQLMKKNLFYNDPSTKTRGNKTSSDCDINSSECWWDCVALLRENTLVTIANLSAHLNLDLQDEDVIELYAHGLIHWAICPSKEARDSCPDASLLSPRRLAIEALSKMTINDVNIDLILATMTSMRPYMTALISTLCTEFLARREDETTREFSIIIMTAIAKCDQFSSRTIARHTSLLLTFIEDFEEHARRNNLINPHMHMPSENMTVSNLSEEHLGTTVEMLRRCARCLSYIAAYEENRPAILKYENRLLDLMTSHFVDYKVVQTLSEILFNCSTKPGMDARANSAKQQQQSSNNSDSDNQSNKSSAVVDTNTEFTYSFLNPNLKAACV